MRKYKIKHCSFRTVREVCEEFNARKFNARSCCGNVIGSCNETVWCPTIGHEAWSNMIYNDGKVIKEYCIKGGDSRRRHVEKMLNENSNEVRITFVKKQGERKYSFIGVYTLDLAETKKSLNTESPACFWSRQPQLYDME